MSQVLEFIFSIFVEAVWPHSVQATVVAVALRGVRCPHCGRSYWYLLRRRVTGRDTSLGPSPALARQNAVERAGRDLQRDTDIVPCPCCGGLPDDMLAAVRRDWLLPTLALALVASVVAAIASVAVDRRGPHPVFWAVTTAGAVVLLGTLFARHRVPRRALHRDPAAADLAIPTATDPADLLDDLSPSDRARLLRGEPVIRYP